MFTFGDGRDWFFEARYGLFIHWGIYAVDGWHEQQHYRLGMSRADYRAIAQRFNPVTFDPDAWIDLAQASGMRYLVVTAKHIDGFCMFDSAASDFTIMHTPYGRDIIAMIADACHRRDFPFGVYFSALDNLHPAYPRAGRGHESPAEPGDRPDADTYLDFVKTQVRELCTNYGELRVFWWDANRTGITDPSINAIIRQLQPSCVINNRGWDSGDFGTPERDYDGAADSAGGFDRPTEACESVGSQSWGYRKDEDYFTPKYLMNRIDVMMARGANYLLNVGPDADGQIPVQQQEILERIARWYEAVKESYDGTVPDNTATDNHEVLITRRGTTLYVHLRGEPRTDAVVLHPITVSPTRAVLLNTDQPVEHDIKRLPSFHRSPVKACLRLHGIPVEDLRDEVIVIRLDFEEPVETDSSSAGGATTVLADR